MKRRDFLKRATLTTAGSFVAPYILPSGRLFAPTGNQLAPHVVLVMFAGGLRNQETVDQLYLTQSQYQWNPDPSINVPGNIMYNMLDGAAPTTKRVYGTGPGGNTPISPILGTTLQSQGVLFKEVEAINPGHYGGSVGFLIPLDKDWLYMLDIKGTYLRGSRSSYYSKLSDVEVMEDSIEAFELQESVVDMLGISVGVLIFIE